jgi:hypothetical protein
MRPTPLHLALARRLFQTEATLPPRSSERPNGGKRGLKFTIKVTRPNAPLSFLPRLGRAAGQLSRTNGLKPATSS